MMKLPETLRLPASLTSSRTAKVHAAFKLFITTLLRASLALAPANASAQSEPLNLLTVETIAFKKVTQVESRSTYTGTIGPRRQTALSSETLGLVETIMFDTGDQIEKGDVVCQLNAQRLMAQLRQLKAERRAAEAMLAELNAGPRTEQISASRSRVQELEIQLAQAKRNLARREELHKENLIASESIESARTAAQRAFTARATAQYQLNELLAGTRKEKIDTQMARVAAIQAGIEAIEVEVAHTQIKAPYKAVVVARHIDEGAVVSPGQPLLTILESDQLEASIGVPVEVARTLSVGDEVEVVVAGQKATGKVRGKLHNVRSESRTQDIVIAMNPNSKERFVPGQLAQIHITTSVETDGFLIPQSALLRGLRGMWECYTVHPEGDGTARVKKASVEVIKTDGSQVLVKGSLGESEHVVVAALHRLTPGQVVRTVLREGNHKSDSRSKNLYRQTEGQLR